MIRKFYDIQAGGGGIKEECERAREQISKAETTLRILQAACKHEETFEGLWSWRIGSTLPATICSICGGLVKMHIPEIVGVQVSDTTEADSSNKVGKQK